MALSRPAGGTALGGPSKLIHRPCSYLLRCNFLFIVSSCWPLTTDLAYIISFQNQFGFTPYLPISVPESKNFLGPVCPCLNVGFWIGHPISQQPACELSALESCHPFLSLLVLWVSHLLPKQRLSQRKLQFSTATGDSLGTGGGLETACVMMDTSKGMPSTVYGK